MHRLSPADKAALARRELKELEEKRDKARESYVASLGLAGPAPGGAAPSGGTSAPSPSKGGGGKGQVIPIPPAPVKGKPPGPPPPPAKGKGKKGKGIPPPLPKGIHPPPGWKPPGKGNKKGKAPKASSSSFVTWDGNRLAYPMH